MRNCLRNWTAIRHALFLNYFAQVKNDVRDAKAWYKVQQPGLEKRFAASIKATLTKLQGDPLRFAVRYKNIRIAHPKIFPYGIHFYLDDINNKIVIIAIVHNKRHPNVAKGRA